MSALEESAIKSISLPISLFPCAACGPQQVGSSDPWPSQAEAWDWHPMALTSLTLWLPSQAGWKRRPQANTEPYATPPQANSQMFLRCPWHKPRDVTCAIITLVGSLPPAQWSHQGIIMTSWVSIQCSRCSLQKAGFALRAMWRPTGLRRASSGACHLSWALLAAILPPPFASACQDQTV